MATIEKYTNKKLHQKIAQHFSVAPQVDVTLNSGYFHSLTVPENITVAIEDGATLTLLPPSWRLDDAQEGY